MANIVISYNRQNKAITRTLASDIEALGHTVWFDQELSGGQAWWDQILETIRNYDVFIFVLDPESLKSTACKREYGYAADLGKPILPVLVAEGVSINLLPPALSEIQFVDYRKQDRDAAFSLARALMSIPPAKPLPDPLPTPPEAPISYLGNFAKRIETTSTLSYEEQSTLVVDLKRSLRDPEAADDARTLLERLRKRRDLFAAMADEIDELLASTRKASSVEYKSQVTQNVKEASVKSTMEAGREPQRTKVTRHPKTRTALTYIRSKTALLEKLIYSTQGAILVTIIGVAVIAFPLCFLSVRLVSIVLLAGAGGAIAGAIMGKNRPLTISAVVGAALGLIFVLLHIVFGYFTVNGYFAVTLPSLIAGLLCVLLGAIFGAILSVILQALKQWFRPV